MNNELLKLFDIKDDVVKTFTVDHKESNYEIDIRFKPSRFSCPTCGSTHFISKGNKKRSLVSVPVNDKPVKMITYVKRYKCIDCNASFSDVNPIAYGDWSFTRTAIISILNRLKPYNATMLPLLECLVFLLPESWKYLILLSELKDIAFLEFY